MITFTTIAEVQKDRRVLLTLPPEVPEGELRIIVSVEPTPPARGLTATELRRRPRSERQAILAAAAALAEADYRDNSELTAFDAFAEEEDGDAQETDSR
jgi:hypothetical protein